MVFKSNMFSRTPCNNIFGVIVVIATSTDSGHYYWIGGMDALKNGEWFWSKTAKPISVSMNNKKMTIGHVSFEHCHFPVYHFSFIRLFHVWAKDFSSIRVALTSFISLG